MDISFLDNLLLRTGLGGVCVGIFFLLFRNLLSAKFLPVLSKDQAYKTIMSIVWMTFTLGVLGLGVWTWLQIVEINKEEASVSSLAIEEPQLHSVKNITSENSVSIKEKDTPHLVKRVFERKIKDRQPYTNVEVATIYLEYIELVGLHDATIQKRINERIKSTVGVHDGYDGTEDLFMRTRKASIDGELLSVVFEGTYYGHGAAGAANELECINLNIKNGEIVEFKDLFRSGYKQKINYLAEKWFDGQKIVNDFAGVADDQKFYFDGNYLYLCFSEYEVAAGSEGAVTVAIKISDIRDIISMNGPLAYAI